MAKDTLGDVAWWLLIIGGLNLGLVTAFGLDVVGLILGAAPVLVTIFNDLVGLSALYKIFKK